MAFCLYSQAGLAASWLYASMNLVSILQKARTGVMIENETRKLMKILHLTPDDIYHVFCLALCLTCVDGQMSDKEGETLTRLGFGLGLGPEDISALADNAQDAIRDTSVSDVIAFSLANLKAKLQPDQLRGVKQILRHLAAADRTVHPEEKALLELINEIWQE